MAAAKSAAGALPGIRRSHPPTRAGPIWPVPEWVTGPRIPSPGPRPVGGRLQRGGLGPGPHWHWWHEPEPCAAPSHGQLGAQPRWLLQSGNSSESVASSELSRPWGRHSRSTWGLAARPGGPNWHDAVASRRAARDSESRLASLWEVTYTRLAWRLGPGAFAMLDIFLRWIIP
jgi:hypothetical protein